VKDEEEREIGTIISFLIDSSGQIEDVLIENKQGEFVRYPVERLKTANDGISLLPAIDRRLEVLSEKLPLARKKRKVLDKLSEIKVIPTEIYENMCKEFDKALKEMKSEAQGLLEDVEKQTKVQDEYIKTLQLSRTYLEIEHEMGTLKEEAYQQSRISILREIKNAQQRKLGFLKAKEKVSSIIQGEEEELKEKPHAKAAAEPKTEQPIEARQTPSEEKQAIPVRVTQE